MVIEPQGGTIHSKYGYVSLSGRTIHSNTGLPPIPAGKKNHRSTLQVTTPTPDQEVAYCDLCFLLYIDLQSGELM